MDFATVIVFGRENTSICMASFFISEEVKVRDGEKASAPRNIGFQQNDKKRKIALVSSCGPVSSMFITQLNNG